MPVNSASQAGPEFLGTQLLAWCGEEGQGNQAKRAGRLENVPLPGDLGMEEGEMLTLSAVIWDKISSAKYRL